MQLILEIWWFSSRFLCVLRETFSQRNSIQMQIFSNNWIYHVQNFLFEVQLCSCSKTFHIQNSGLFLNELKFSFDSTETSGAWCISNLLLENLKFFKTDYIQLTHWGRLTHICVSKLTIIGSDNGLLPGRRQAIIWTNAGIFVNWTLRNKLQWNFNRNSSIFIQENRFENVIWKMAAILSQPQCVKEKSFAQIFLPSWQCYLTLPSGWLGLWGFLWWAPLLRGTTTTGSALDGAILNFTQILAYLVHNMSRSQLYLGFGHFGWLPSFLRSITFWQVYGQIVFHLLKLLKLLFFFWLTYYCSIGPCFSVRV